MSYRAEIAPVKVTLAVTAVTPGDITLTKGMDCSFVWVVGIPAGCETFRSQTAVPTARTARIAIVRIHFARPLVPVSAAAGCGSSGTAWAGWASGGPRSIEA